MSWVVAIDGHKLRGEDAEVVGLDRALQDKDEVVSPEMSKRARSRTIGDHDRDQEGPVWQSS